MPQLAAVAPHENLARPLLYRILNANFRLGEAENARAVAAIAAQKAMPNLLRIEALRELAEWTHPGGRDRVMGHWRPLPARPGNIAIEATRRILADIFRASDSVQEEGAKLVAKLGLKEAAPTLLERLADKERFTSLRLEALKALDVLHDERLEKGMQLALGDGDPKVRTAGRRLLAKHRPDEAAGVLEAAVGKGTIVEQQGVFSILGDLKSPRADAALYRWLDRLQAQQVPLEIQLELLEAAGKRAAPAVKQKLAAFEASRAKSSPLARYREALAGGDAAAGKQIFLHKAEVSCVRCHKVDKDGGEVGPDLTKVGSKQKREYLLESIIDPNKEIAKGFETVVLGMSNGQINVGIIKGEDAREIRLITAEGHIIAVPKNQVEERSRGKSAMPEDIMKFLSKSELRNLVEFLAGLK
jgi:quinoprotein glucose dehydrogenase